MELPYQEMHVKTRCLRRKGRYVFPKTLCAIVALLSALVAGCVLCRVLVAGVLLFSAACALLGSWFLLAFPCAGIETAVPAVLLVASMIMSPPAVAVGVDCLKTGVSVPLSMFWCSCTASRCCMAFFAFSNVRSGSSCRRSESDMSRIPVHRSYSWLQGYIEPCCTALRSR